MGNKHLLKSKRKTLRGVFLFVIILILLYLFIFKSDYFVIKHIEVLGNKKLSYDEIVNASSCSIGDNILRINVKKGEENINRFPYIKNCKIKRKFPDKIIIEIEERQEVAILSNTNNFALIDREGYILTIRKDNKNLHLPQIIGLEQEEINVGDNIFHRAGINNLDQFIDLSNQMGLLDKMEYIDFSDEKNIIFQIYDDTNVAFGSLDNVKYKLDFLIKIFEDLNNKGIKAKQIFFNKGENPIIVTDNR